MERRRAGRGEVRVQHGGDRKVELELAGRKATFEALVGRKRERQSAGTHIIDWVRLS